MRAPERKVKKDWWGAAVLTVSGAVKALEETSIKHWRVVVVAWVILVAWGVVAFGQLAAILTLMGCNIGLAVGLLIAMRKVLLSFNHWWLWMVAWVIFLGCGAALGPLGLIVALMGSNIGFAVGLRIGIRLGLWGDI